MIQYDQIFDLKMKIHWLSFFDLYLLDYLIYDINSF